MSMKKILFTLACLSAFGISARENTYNIQNNASGPRVIEFLSITGSKKPVIDAHGTSKPSITVAAHGHATAIVDGCVKKIVAKTQDGKLAVKPKEFSLAGNCFKDKTVMIDQAVVADSN
jgi:hypothetical protein